MFQQISKIIGFSSLGLLLFAAANQGNAVPYKDCSGGIAVNGLFDYWHKDKDGKMQLTKTLTNNSCESALYYIVNIARVENPFAKNGKKEKDITLTPKEMAQSILPSKTRLILAPKHKQSINLYMPEGNHNDKLSFYRVSFQPVIPSKKYGFDIDEKTEKKLQAQTTIGMGVATAVVVEPVHPDYSYSDSQKGNQVTLTNKGNALLFADFSGSCIKPRKTNNTKANPAVATKDITKDKASKKTKSAKAAAKQSVKSKVTEIQCNDNGYASLELKLYPQQSKTVDLSHYKDQVMLTMKKGYQRETHYYNVSHE